MCFPSYHFGISYASKFCANILGLNKCIPYDPDNLFEEIPHGLMPACHVSLVSWETFQIQSFSSQQDQVVAPLSRLPLLYLEMVY